jgi:quercetin dioxygenase-like cupin family protein
MTQPLTPLVVRQDGAPTIQGPVGGRLTFTARGKQTGGLLTAFVNEVAPGEGPPLHTHADEAETWFILEGRLRFLLDGALEDAPAGTFVFVPKGVAHAFQNIGDTPARLLVQFMPSGHMESFFDQFAALDADADIPEAFRRIGASVGMDVVGPPLGRSHPR